MDGKKKKLSLVLNSEELDVDSWRTDRRWTEDEEEGRTRQPVGPSAVNTNEKEWEAADPPSSLHRLTGGVTLFGN